jgi:adenylate cyclase
MSRSSDSYIKRSRSKSWSIPFPAVLFLVVILFSALGIWRDPDRGLSDLLARIRISNSPLKQSLRIFSVDLTDSAERNLGDRIDNRQAFSDLFKVLGDGVLNGGMDFLFQKSINPDIDRRMAEEAAKMNSLVLAIVPVPAELSLFTGKDNDAIEKEILKKQLWHPRVAESGDIPVAWTLQLPLPELARNAKHLGHIAIMPDDDGLYRRIPLFYRWEDGYMPSFSLALAAEELKVDYKNVEIHPGSHIFLPLPNGKSINIPIDRSGSARVPIPVLWAKGVKHWPLDTVVEMSKDPAGAGELINQWSDGVVIAADLTTIKKDYGSTPIEAAYPLSGLHTSMLNGILTNTFYTPMPLFLKLLIVLLLLAGIFLTGMISRDTPFHIVFAAALLALAGIACLLWFRFLILPWFFAPALGVAGSWAVAFGMRLLKSRDQRLLLESALNRYFSPALTSRVLAEKNIDLVPMVKELTILFVDISGFTRWSSNKTPELVHVFLTDYLESMSAILFRHGGTIDKFMGDGILAFFGDPLDQTDHAPRALRAALDMQLKAKELCGIWLDTAGMDLKIRIGVNTGPVIVGNLGSLTRIEYTVIGAAVNLGQRMESNAPVGSILVSESTWAKAQGQFQFGEVLAVKVKGYEAPVTAYILEKELEAADGKGSE